jgi:hypothetical protein
VVRMASWRSSPDGRALRRPREVWLAAEVVTTGSLLRVESFDTTLTTSTLR